MGLKIGSGHDARQMRAEGPCDPVVGGCTLQAARAWASCRLLGGLPIMLQGMGTGAQPWAPTPGCLWGPGSQLVESVPLGLP